MLTKYTEMKLVAALMSSKMTSAEIRQITGWTAPKMSIRKAVARIADRNGVKMICRKANSDGRTRVYSCTPAVSASMIAALPDVLAALKVLRHAVDNLPASDMFDELEEAAAEADQAIAKAGGAL